MSTKLMVWGSTIGAVLASGVALVSHAATAFLTVPTGTAAQYTAQVGAQFTDAGTLEIVGLVIAIPLFFYIVHQVMGLFPKARGGSRR
jgi:hypothetical protein